MDYYRMMVQVANENCQFYQFLRNVVRARLMSNAAGDHLDRGSVPELFVYDVNSSGAMIDAMFQFQGSRRIDCQGDGSGPLLSRVQKGSWPRRLLRLWALFRNSRGGAEAILASLPILKSALILAAFKFAHCNVFRHCLDDLAGDPGPYPSQLFSLHHREPRT